MFAANDQEQNRWENDTVIASRAKTEGKGKDEPAEPDSQESWQKLVARTTVVLSRRCDFVGECFCKIRAWFMLDRVLSKRGLPVEDFAFL